VEPKKKEEGSKKTVPPESENGRWPAEKREDKGHKGVKGKGKLTGPNWMLGLS